MESWTMKMEERVGGIQNKYNEPRKETYTKWGETTQGKGKTMMNVGNGILDDGEKPALMSFSEKNSAWTEPWERYTQEV